jgi:small subunit ribosomal protein S6
MAKYEAVFITKSGLTDQEKEAFLKQATEVITKNEGKVSRKELWLDKQRITFSIKKNREGSYFLVQFEIPAAALPKLYQAWKLNESILRFLTVKQEK